MGKTKKYRGGKKSYDKEKMKHTNTRILIQKNVRILKKTEDKDTAKLIQRDINKMCKTLPKKYYDKVNCPKLKSIPKSITWKIVKRKNTPVEFAPKLSNALIISSKAARSLADFEENEIRRGKMKKEKQAEVKERKERKRKEEEAEKEKKRNAKEIKVSLEKYMSLKKKKRMDVLKKEEEAKEAKKKAEDLKRFNFLDLHARKKKQISNANKNDSLTTILQAEIDKEAEKERLREERDELPKVPKKTTKEKEDSFKKWQKIGEENMKTSKFKKQYNLNNDVVFQNNLINSKNFGDEFRWGDRN